MPDEEEMIKYEEMIKWAKDRLNKAQKEAQKYIDFHIQCRNDLDSILMKNINSETSRRYWNWKAMQPKR
jgi:hypothetical protein